jgi:hypothetical protein
MLFKTVQIGSGFVQTSDIRLISFRIRYCYVIKLNFYFHFPLANSNNAFSRDWMTPRSPTLTPTSRECNNDDKNIKANRHGKVPGAGWKRIYKLQEFNSQLKVLQSRKDKLLNSFNCNLLKLMTENSVSMRYNKWKQML